VNQRIYIEQDCAWWAFTPEEFKRFLDAGEKGPWKLDNYGARLRSRPRCVRSEKDADDYNRYYTTNGALLFSWPCDWQHEEWENARFVFELENFTASTR